MEIVDELTIGEFRNVYCHNSKLVTLVSSVVEMEAKRLRDATKFDANVEVKNYLSTAAEMATNVPYEGWNVKVTSVNKVINKIKVTSPDTYMGRGCTNIEFLIKDHELYPLIRIRRTSAEAFTVDEDLSYDAKISEEKWGELLEIYT